MMLQRRYCLIVDDSEFDRHRIRRMLKSCDPGLPYIVAQSVEQAKERLVEFDIGLIILENILPDGDGLAFVHWLRADPKHSGIPVALVSDFPTPFMYAKAEQAEVCGVWSKSKFGRGEISRLLHRFSKRLSAHVA